MIQYIVSSGTGVAPGVGFQLIPNPCFMEFLDNVKLSSRDGEEYTGHENSYRSGRNPRWLPGFSFTYGDQPTFLFLVEFHREIEVLNDKEYSILWILYCYSLQQLLPFILRPF